MIVCGFVARLYPTSDQAARLNQWSGSLRLLWNRRLDAEKAAYAARGKFIWKKPLQPIAVGMKRQPGLEWLADLPAHAVLDTSARMDGALRRMVKQRQAGRDGGFPKRTKKLVNEAGVYCVGQASDISAGEVTLPKLGRVTLRGGTLPQGRLLASRVWRDGARWMLSAPFECARSAAMEPTRMTIGVDLGVATLMTAFDGVGFDEQAAPSLCTRRSSGCAGRRAASRVARRVRPGGVLRPGVLA